ncbi:MAG: SDR family oxidoreductase [Candidatus Obscuribacterales bacterium]|nr:SDR family oxidoreductase [Candidatus Obscuribacterales bacterium]
MEKKVVLVTGANKGIGKEASKQLGKMGFKVFIGSRDLSRGQATAKELKADGIDADAVQLDVTSQSSVDAAMATIEKSAGKLDVLVNNAGIVTERTTALDTTEIAKVEETMQTNFFGPLRVTKSAQALLEKSKAPRVVNVSSTLGSLSTLSDPGSEFANFRILGYTCSKAALNMLTVVTAGAIKNVKVNSICPGYVATDINNNSGPRSVEQGAAIIVKMATLEEDGPTAGFFNDDGIIPW